MKRKLKSMTGGAGISMVVLGLLCLGSAAHLLSGCNQVQGVSALAAPSLDEPSQMSSAPRGAELPSADDVIPEEEEDELGESDSEVSEREFSRRILRKEAADFSERRVQIVVHKSMKEIGLQYLTVSVDGKLEQAFTVSTAWERRVKGKSGRVYNASTPVGRFIPDGMQVKRWSNLWQVNLQYVIRFSGGVWIHATTPDHYAELGAPASGGCVRMYPEDAEQLYKIVSSYGLNETAITVLEHAPGEPQVKPKKAPGWRVLQIAEDQIIMTAP